MEAGFDASEMNALFGQFERLGKVYKENLKRVAALGGVYFASTAESAAPKGSKTHRRYSTAKVNKSMRAPKGMGTVVATYTAGNLSRSMRVLDLKKTVNGVYVGAKLARGSAKGTFSGMKADGYYVGMVEKGTKIWAGKPFFKAAFQRSKNTIIKIMTREFERIAEKFTG